ncbi:MAG: energy transducer TonB [Alphaproteobacteria bacterium]|nr:MAG: energy transducer TonB [Alphaproteobacteria bacterium]
MDDIYVGRVRWVLPVSDEMPAFFPSRATADIPSLFSKNDYPRAAFQAHQQGTTSYHIWIDGEGSVTGCTIVQSSGSAELDETTCRIITERARFHPARDAKGRVAPDEYSGRVHWVIP